MKKSQKKKRNIIQNLNEDEESQNSDEDGGDEGD